MKRIIISMATMVFCLLVLFSCSKSTVNYTQDGNWVSKSDFGGTNRSEAVVFTINDIAYVGTGLDVNSKRLKDFWSYDPTDNNWFQLADLGKGSPDSALASPRNSAVAFSVNNIGYVGTGYDGFNPLSDFWSYDPTANTWAHKANFAAGNSNIIPRFDAIAFSIGNFGYLGTGNDGNGNYLKDFWQYDPTSDSWTPKVSYGGAKRAGAVCWVYNNKGYVVSGVNGSGSSVNDFWVFDPSQPDAQAWTELRHINNFSTDTYDDGYTTIVRSNAVAFVINGTAGSGDGNDKAYIACGNNGALTNLVWEYDFKTDLWKEKAPYEGGAREGAVGFSVKNRGFVALGRSSTAANDDTREFKPNDVANAND